MNIIQSLAMTNPVQVRFPRSKRRRIRKKWAKRASSFIHVPKPEAFCLDGVWIMHPATYQRLRREVATLPVRPAPAGLDFATLVGGLDLPTPKAKPFRFGPLPYQFEPMKRPDESLRFIFEEPRLSRVGSIVSGCVA